MAYDWTSTGNRTATPAGGPAVPPPHVAEAQAGEPAAPDQVAVAAVVEEFIAAAELGAARNRTGRRYRPSALRDLRGILRNHVVQAIGDMPLREVRAEHLQDLIDELAADGLSVSRIRSVVSAIRALYVYALEQGVVESSAAGALEVPRDDLATEPMPGAGEGSWHGDGPSMREQAANWKGAAESAWRDSSFVRERQDQRRGDDRPGGPQIAGMRPDKILSLVLRAILVVFLLLALVSLAEALLVPA